MNKAWTGIDRTDLISSMDRIRNEIHARMTDYTKASNEHPMLAEFIDTANEILLSNDAKRLRCILPVLIADQCDFSQDECLNYGIVIELLHYTSLIHDDVIDEDQYRRGVKTLNNLFPNSQAVLIGDFIVCKAIDYCLTFTHSDKIIAQIVEAMKKLVTGIIMEQRYLPKERAIERYKEMAILKTGSLFALSFGLPFIDDNNLHEAKKCGEIFGTLFQVYDDYLDRDDDDPGMNIFGLCTNKEIIEFWDEQMNGFMKYCRILNLEPAVKTLFQHLHDQNYFIEKDTSDGLLFRCPQF